MGVGVLWLCMSRNSEAILVSGVWIDSTSASADLYDPISALVSHSLRKCSLRARGSSPRWVARWRSEELFPSWGPRKKRDGCNTDFMKALYVQNFIWLNGSRVNVILFMPREKVWPFLQWLIWNKQMLSIFPDLYQTTPKLDVKCFKVWTEVY